MNGQRTECALGSNKPARPSALPMARPEQVMKAGSLQPPSMFYRMIEAHGDRALIDSFLLKRPSVSERMAAGKALRKRVPRSAQATFDTRADRTDSIDGLTQQDA